MNVVSNKSGRHSDGEQLSWVTVSEEAFDGEGRAKLRRYFELAWRIFERLEREAALDDLNLTDSEVNPTVKPSKPSHQ